MSPSTRPPGDLSTAEPAGGPGGDELDHSVSFPELVWAHFLRQNELQAMDGLHAQAEAEYRRRLRVFKNEHGEIVNAYWCRNEASGAALTEKKKRLRWRPWRHESILRLHTATDWRTREAPEVAGLLHTCDTLAIRVGEVLRETSERIALQWILAVASRLLGLVDRARGEARPDTATLNSVVKKQRAELQQIERYYQRAGHKAARLVYFQGMMRGVCLLVLLTGLAVLLLRAVGSFHPHDRSAQYLLASYAMGAIGAVVSVMSRMATTGRFQLDHEVGRKPIRRLGSFRPFIGATFALVLYFALRSDLLQIGTLKPGERTIYFYATISFLAGFSERWAKVILEGAVASTDSSPEQARSHPDNPEESA